MMGRNLVRLLPLLLALACSTPPRVSTPEERQQVETALAFVESGITIAFATGKLGKTPEENQAAYVRAQSQISALRAEVAASEATPVSVPLLIQRITNFALAWAVPAPRG